MSDPAFSVTSLQASLGNTQILHGINLSLAAGRWTSIIGPNGAGKSTLLKVLAGLLPFQGEICLMGSNLRTWPHSQRARTISWLGQGEVAADDLTVYDVVMLGRLPHQSWLGQPDKTDQRIAEISLRKTNAWAWRDRPLGDLSGGERQRVLLARALAVDGRIFLMDEPLANLDPPHQSDWLALVRELVADGRTVISVLHEVSMALHANDLVILEHGRLIHHGACEDAASHRVLEKTFDNRIKIYPLDGQWVVLPKVSQAWR